MNLAPFDVRPVIERLRSRVEDLRDVGEAADFAAVFERSPPLPSAYVVLEEERFDSADYAEHGEIRTTAILAVLVGVRHFRAADRGAAHAGEARQILGRTRAALVGWEPQLPVGATCQLPFRLQGQSHLMQYDQADWWWVDRYVINTETNT